MKAKSYRKPTGVSRLLLASFMLATANPALAQTTYYWDADADTTIDTGGAGIWDITSSLWRSGSDIGALSLWPNTDPAVDTAQFAGTAGTIALNSDSANLNFSRIVFATTGYEIAAPASGTATLNVSGASPARITTNASVSATISAGISGASTITLNKAGAGTLTLSGANTLTGPITVAASDTSGGILNISGDQSAATGGYTISGTSTVNFQAGSTIAVAAGKSIALSNSAGTHALNVAGTVTSAGSLNVRGRSTLNINSGANWTQSGTMAVQPLNTSFAAAMNVPSGGNFTYNGTANIILAKSNNATNNGAATITISGGTFTTGKGFDNSSVTAITTSSTTLNFSNGGTLKLSANINPLIIQGSTTFLVRTNNAAGGVIDTNGNDATIPVAISGVGGITKAGAGTLTLSAANTYAGNTTVTGGTLVLGADNISNDASRVTLGSAGILKLDYAGTDTVQRLYVNGNRMPNGVYGYDSVDSIAQSINSYFEATGTGTLTVSDTVAPTLAPANIVDDKAGGPVVANTLVNYTVTFSEEMNASTISAADFGNTGTATFTIGTVTQVSPSAFLVPVTPTSAGTLQLSVLAAADIQDFVNNPLDTTSAIADDTTLTVNAPASGYATWSGGAPADGDANNDGVENAVAWALGAADPAENAIGLLPTLDNTSDPNYLIFTFQRSDLAKTDPNTSITVEYDDNLSGWTTAVDDNNNVEIEETDGSPKDTVIVKLKRSTLGASGNLFVRANVVVTP
ncbi:MAG: autotransporter-associated beta strand repeat-containing protein [Akkermansiaceae bacterium]|nr:autotransporter-associated beta strand repeat-containing protein [Akkermansiaceae bacterium]